MGFKEGDELRVGRNDGAGCISRERDTVPDCHEAQTLRTASVFSLYDVGSTSCGRDSVCKYQI